MLERGHAHVARHACATQYASDDLLNEVLTKPMTGHGALSS
jgi:hypothetical protein